eukprot:Rmarinus@m.12228
MWRTKKKNDLSVCEQPIAFTTTSKASLSYSETWDFDTLVNELDSIVTPQSPPALPSPDDFLASFPNVSPSCLPPSARKHHRSDISTPLRLSSPVTETPVTAVDSSEEDSDDSDDLSDVIGVRSLSAEKTHSLVRFEGSPARSALLQHLRAPETPPSLKDSPSKKPPAMDDSDAACRIIEADRRELVDTGLSEDQDSLHSIVLSVCESGEARRRQVDDDAVRQRSALDATEEENRRQSLDAVEKTLSPLKERWERNAVEIQRKLEVIEQNALAKQRAKEEQEQKRREAERKMKETMEREKREAREREEKEALDRKKALEAEAKKKREKELQEEAAQQERERERERERARANQRQASELRAQAAAVPPTPAANLKAYGGSVAEDHARRCATIYEKVRSEARKFAESSRKVLKRAIGVELNSVAATSEQVEKKTARLLSLFEEARRTSPEAYSFCMEFFSQRTVDQSYAQVMKHPDSAYAIAYVVVAVAAAHPPVQDVIIAAFHEDCPYTVPRYPQPSSSLSLSDQLKSLGFGEDSDGPHGMETEDSWIERMRGYVTLYSAILTCPNFLNVRNPYVDVYPWTFLSTLCNLKPERITVVVLLAFLQTSSYDMTQIYPTQFPKVLALVAHELRPRLPKGFSGAHARLGLFLDDCRNKSLQPPKGRHLLRTTTSLAESLSGWQEGPTYRY